MKVGEWLGGSRDSGKSFLRALSSFHPNFTRERGNTHHVKGNDQHSIANYTHPLPTSQLLFKARPNEEAIDFIRRGTVSRTQVSGKWLRSASQSKLGLIHDWHV